MDYQSINELVSLDDETFHLNVLALAESHGKLQWQIGDYALAYTIKGAHRDGTDAEASTREFAERYGWTHADIRDWRRVSEAYEVAERSATLRWSHHRAVISREDRLGWLAAASEYGWSIRKMLEEIETADAEAEKERQKQARSEAFKQRLQDAGLFDRWKQGENDQEMLDELARFQEEEREQEQAKLDYEDRVRRNSNSLATALRFEVEALPITDISLFDNAMSGIPFNISKTNIRKAISNLNDLADAWED